jgi:ribonuclease III
LWQFAADVFEAYVGGLHEDQGLELVDTWLMALFTPYIHAMHEDALTEQLDGLNISSPFPGEHSSRPRHQTSSSATSVTTTQIFRTTSFASLTTSTTDAAASTSSATPHGSAPNGCTAELNERLSQRRQIVQWADTNVAPGASATFPNWKSTATVDGRLVGTGYGKKIKISRNAASYHALVALGLKDPTSS